MSLWTPCAVKKVFFSVALGIVAALADRPHGDLIEVDAKGPFHQRSLSHKRHARAEVGDGPDTSLEPVLQALWPVKNLSSLRPVASSLVSVQHHALATAGVDPDVSKWHRFCRKIWLSRDDQDPCRDLKNEIKRIDGTWLPPNDRVFKSSHPMDYFYLILQKKVPQPDEDNVLGQNIVAMKQHIQTDLGGNPDKWRRPLDALLAALDLRAAVDEAALNLNDGSMRSSTKESVGRLEAAIKEAKSVFGDPPDIYEGMRTGFAVAEDIQKKLVAWVHIQEADTSAKELYRTSFEGIGTNTDFDKVLVDLHDSINEFIEAFPQKEVPIPGYEKAQMAITDTQRRIRDAARKTEGQFQMKMRIVFSEMITKMNKCSSSTILLTTDCVDQYLAIAPLKDRLDQLQSRAALFRDLKKAADEVQQKMERRYRRKFKRAMKKGLRQLNVRVTPSDMDLQAKDVDEKLEIATRLGSEFGSDRDQLSELKCQLGGLSKLMSAISTAQQVVDTGDAASDDGKRRAAVSLRAGLTAGKCLPASFDAQRHKAEELGEQCGGLPPEPRQYEVGAQRMCRLSSSGLALTLLAALGAASGWPAAGA